MPLLRRVSLALAAAAVMLVGSSLPVRAAAPDNVRAAPPFTDKDIARALQQVKADPNLAPDKTVRTLKWAGSDTPRNKDPASLPFLAWVASLLGWIAQSARVLVWTAVGVAVALLGLYLLNLLRVRQQGRKPVSQATPTHVQDLDIRPESLPDNIGTAARELWDGGEHRAALSLLYRGLLSRLVHVHHVPIRDSSTEGDCLKLTAERMRADKRGYVGRLVQVWQHAVYGDLQPETVALYALCDEFSPALDAA